MKFPPSIQKLIDDFAALPTVGPKTAERYVIFLLKQPQNKLEEFAKHIYDLKNKIKVCSNCLGLSEFNPCEICADKTRDRSLLCIVSGFSELRAIEDTKIYQGLYYILGKNIRPQDGESSIHLNTKRLENKLRQGGIKEIILALSPNLEGETSSIYLRKIIKPYNIKTTKLARGLPMGSDIEYTDEITLNNALNNRKEF